jgi:hypothetical protein
VGAEKTETRFISNPSHSRLLLHLYSLSQNIYLSQTVTNQPCESESNQRPERKKEKGGPSVNLKPERDPTET